MSRLRDMSFTDYFLLRTPKEPLTRLGKKKTTAEKISRGAIAVSLLGIILGIFVSFFVTGLQPSRESASASATEPASTNGAAASPTPASQPNSSAEPSIIRDFSLARFLTISLITLVICGISYQGLYFVLDLYKDQPLIIIFFVAFQYGYFWQSLIKGGAAVLS